MSIHVEVLHALTTGKQKEITAMQHNPFVVVVALLLQQAITALGRASW